MEFTRIILYPLHTEKTYTFGALEQKKYAFAVDVKATKYDINIAFESIYGIHPVKIATQIRKVARVRTGTMKPGFSKLTKIALITLPKGTDIAASNKELPKGVENTKKVEKSSEMKKKEIGVAAEKDVKIKSPSADVSEKKQHKTVKSKKASTSSKAATSVDVKKKHAAPKKSLTTKEETK
ncbi:MAG: 50S ribosomal protein L23 [Mycoplasmataceae bacterium]|jgi:large subunit ribosomal protein L23|nr:50S ribosomal protein L23 [Mycoplasmataceae bacterium]